jgi:hypothetical protein
MGKLQFMPKFSSTAKKGKVKFLRVKQRQGRGKRGEHCSFGRSMTCYISARHKIAFYDGLPGDRVADSWGGQASFFVRPGLLFHICLGKIETEEVKKVFKALFACPTKMPK